MDTESRKPEEIRREIKLVQMKIAADMEAMLHSGVLVKGSLACRLVTCGKENCRCSRGERHRVWVLSYWDKPGKLVNVTLSGERLTVYQGPAERYRVFREARARVARRQKQILTLLNELERSLLMEAPEQTRRGK